MKKSKYLTVLRLENKKHKADKKYQLSVRKEEKAESAKRAAARRANEVEYVFDDDFIGPIIRDNNYKNYVLAVRAANKAYLLHTVSADRQQRARTQRNIADHRLASAAYPFGPVRRSMATKLLRSR